MSIGVGRIPLDGALIEILRGKHAGKRGVAFMVSDAKDKVRSLIGDEKADFVNMKRARHGAKWFDSWFELGVDLGPEGTVTKLDCTDVRCVDGQFRPEGFHTN